MLPPAAMLTCPLPGNAAPFYPDKLDLTCYLQDEGGRQARTARAQHEPRR